MRRLLAQTIAIQSFGVVLMLLTTLLVSRFGGPSAQGSFALVKSFNDLQVAVFSLGLPPAIVIMLNRTGSGHQAVERLIWRYGVALLLALPPINLLLLSLTGAPKEELVYAQALLIGWAIALFTIFSFLRALLLVQTDGATFSVLSIVHWVIIFAVTAILLNRTHLIFEIAYFAAGAGSLALIHVVIRRYRSKVMQTHARDCVEWPLLRAQSANVMIQAVFFGLQPFLTNAVLARTDADLSATGLFSIAALVITLPNLLIALVAPVLLNRWSKSLQWCGYGSVQRHALILGAMAQVAALAVLPLLPWGIRLVFGEPFIGATVPTAILLLSVFAVVAGRIVTPAVQGLGRNDLVSWSCAIRVAAIVVVVAAAYAAGESLLVAMAIGWCTGEYAALGSLLVGSRGARKREFSHRLSNAVSPPPRDCSSLGHER